MVQLARRAAVGAVQMMLLVGGGSAFIVPGNPRQASSRPVPTTHRPLQDDSCAARPNAWGRALFAAPPTTPATAQTERPTSSSSEAPSQPDSPSTSLDAQQQQQQQPLPPNPYSMSSLAPVVDPVGRIDANPQALIEWVKDRRGEVHSGVTIGNVETEHPDPDLGEWSLQATQSIKKGTVLVSVPNVLTLSPVRRKFKSPENPNGIELRDLVNSGRLPPQLAEVLKGAIVDDKTQKVMDALPQSYWRIRLAILLVAERMKGADSFWWPYLRNLPEKYAYMPIFYNNSEFGSIQIPSLMRTVQSRCRMLVNISDGYLRQLSVSSPLENPFSEEVHANDMGWGLCAASSRALRSIPGIPADQPTLVPLIDLCRHDFNPSCYIQDYSSSGGSIKLVAGRDLNPGDLLTTSYGNLTNAELLLDYGFTVADNPHDRFDFMLSDDLIKASQKLMAFETEAFGDRRIPNMVQPWQERVLDELGLAPRFNMTPYWPSVKMAFGGANRVDGRLLALLRVMYCRDRRLLAMSNVTYQDLQSYYTKFRISTFERRAIMHSLGIAATLLRRLPTTLTEDWRLLTGQSLYIAHDDTSKTVVFRSMPTGDSRDELMETVTTDEAVVREYNPYREAELMERREPVIQHIGSSMNRCLREILQFRISQKKILYQVISDICHTMYGHGLVQSVQDMEELEEERAVMAVPEESSRLVAPGRGGSPQRSLESILEWAEKSIGGEVGL